MHPTEELIRRAWAIAASRNAEDFIPLCTDDVEFTIVSRIADPNDSYTGHEGVRRWATESVERWSEFSADVERVFVVDAGAVADVTLRLRGQLSGADVEWRGAQATRVRDGLIAAYSFHETLDEAAQALGHPTLNVALVEAHQRAFQRRDYEASNAMMDPDIEVDYRGVMPDIGVLRGTARGSEVVRRWFDDFEGIQFESLECEPAGDGVFVRYRIAGRGRRGEVPAEIEVFQVWTFDDDHRAVALRAFLDEAEARAVAAQLSASGSR